MSVEATISRYYLKSLISWKGASETYLTIQQLPQMDHELIATGSYKQKHVFVSLYAPVPFNTNNSARGDPIVEIVVAINEW